MSALVALTAQNTTGVTAVHELPPEFVRAQLDAVFDDIGVDAAKTGMLFSRALDRDRRRLPRGAPGAARRRPGDGRELRRASCCCDDAVETLVDAALPARDRGHAEPARGRRRSPARARPRPSSPSACTSSARRAVVVTGGHGPEPVDHLFDGERHVEIPVERHDVAATHGSGCTHSATLAALLARGEDARGRRAAAPRAPRRRPSATGSPSSAPARARSTCSTCGRGRVTRLARRDAARRCASASRSSTRSRTTSS